MINYILGSLIAVLTIYIIIKQIKKVKEGKCGCGHSCAGCSGQCSVMEKEE